VHWRGPGGDQERELAAKYRDWSKTISINSPFTSRLLEEIAKATTATPNGTIRMLTSANVYVINSRQFTGEGSL
jgi:hypothetical protein